ncbi:hypothetical protein EDC14_101060 [Hydrogenispora ethanolica]|uniref:Uncharacterized protein n=2 Tax=Hydrogenispora ethanolica TaxID=1082276 RepID=A0A4R1RU42_HYDET|nr:hypothetical protein EDC14_101060 [Hydrogenispora ethanolica]
MRMGKKSNNFEKNGSHLSGYNAKLAEMREKEAKRRADLQAQYLRKIQQQQQEGDGPQPE